MGSCFSSPDARGPERHSTGGNEGPKRRELDSTGGMLLAALGPGDNLNLSDHLQSQQSMNAGGEGTDGSGRIASGELEGGDGRGGSGSGGHGFRWPAM